MKILIVSNEYTRNNRIGNPIVERIVHSTNNDSRVDCAYFIPFTNKISDLFKIRKRLTVGDIDVFHIHFGGLYALIIFVFIIGIRVPKVITFHGTDLHAGELATTKSLLIRTKIRLSRIASLISILFFDRFGVVSESLIKSIPNRIYNRSKSKLFIQRLGVDYELFKIMNQEDAQRKLGISKGRYFLFSDKSNTPIKRKDIAEAIMSILHDEGYELLTMCGVDPNMVPYYINASDAILLTSDMEGSPNIVREALVLNKRVFSVDVGDVKNQISGLENSCIIPRSPEDAAMLIKERLSIPYKDQTRETLRDNLDSDYLTRKVIDVYEELFKH